MQNYPIKIQRKIYIKVIIKTAISITLILTTTIIIIIIIIIITNTELIKKSSKEMIFLVIVTYWRKHFNYLKK